MPKQPTPSRNGTATPPAGAPETAPQMRILGQYIKDLSFESPNAPQSLRDPGDSPNLNVEVNVGGNPVEADIYECVIDFKAKASSKSMVIYNIELTYAGVFELKNFPADMLHPVLFVNCPAILFPFLRRLVGDLSREGGFPPLWLEPIDFGGLYQQRVGQMQGGAGAGPAATS